MAPPIRQCEYGHSVCAGCEARLARCPTCRGAFLAATNATLNAIALAVRLPCRYRGCRALLRLADKARHEERCRHREYPCPNVRCTPWTGTLDDLLQHTLKDHATDTALVTLNQKTDLSYTYSRTKPFEISHMDGGVNRVAKSLLLVETVVKSTEELENNKNRDKKKSSSVDMAEESLQPRALFRFHLRFDAKLVVLQSALQYIGPPDNCKLFRYKVSVGSRDGSFKLSSWSEATGEEVDEAVNDGKVLRVDGASFQHLIDKDGRFIVRVKVVVGRLPSLVQPVDNPPAL
ncbi:uncharacterized protein LOC113214199 [Frankliniella occidentalis]|uniref:RING-type E3 ubiquitin transferase n=1 Tax=Frankliniella occidentalis TaxID=133901 RepID=A0A6J1T6N0_FRAOC|nr:uncharacterized protein LOC113214199 [Frankliniella occidentalis]